MSNIIVKVNGMTCDGCVRSVTNILKNQAGVEKVNVNLADAQAEIDFDESQVSLEKLKSAVAILGFEMEI